MIVRFRFLLLFVMNYLGYCFRAFKLKAIFFSKNNVTNDRA